MDTNGLNIQDLKDRMMTLMGEAQVNLMSKQPKPPQPTLPDPKLLLPNPAQLPRPIDLPKPSLPMAMSLNQLPGTYQQVPYVPPQMIAPQPMMPDPRLQAQIQAAHSQISPKQTTISNNRDPRSRNQLKPEPEKFKTQYYDEDETVILIPLTKQIRTIKDPRKAKWNSPEHDNKMMDLTSWHGLIPDFYLESLSMRERVQNFV